MSYYKLKQEHRLLQKLTPMQIQYLELLHLPILNFEERIKSEIEQNPLLEEAENEKIEDDNFNSDKEKNENITVEDLIDNEDDYNYERNSKPQYDYSNVNIIESVPLAEDIIEQLKLQNLSEKELIIASEIIGNLEESGYLERDLNLIVNDLFLKFNMKVSFNEAENILFKIQKCEPIGMGSRNLRECLLVQLEFKKVNNSNKTIAIEILKNEFTNFSKKHFEIISKNLNISIEKVKDAIALISHLNPKPNTSTETESNKYIIPDFTVENNNGELIINLNNRNIPHLRINNDYKKMLLERNNSNIEAKNFIKNKIDSAKNFILAIEQRNRTMLDIMGIITEVQKKFFISGGTLKPLVYADITSLVKKDKSTISRVVNNKYVQTDYGIFPLRYFFSEGIITQSGEVISNKEVKNMLVEIIKNENRKKPLSDEKILLILKSRGIEVARRTVSKYREMLNIPVARLRREI